MSYRDEEPKFRVKVKEFPRMAGRQDIYFFDVKQDITVGNLRYIYKKASKLQESHLRIESFEFRGRRFKETENDENITLKNLFEGEAFEMVENINVSTKKEIIEEFIVYISGNYIKEYDSLISCKFTEQKEYICPEHHKFLGFYDFICKRSLCSECLFGGHKHEDADEFNFYDLNGNGKNYKEKSDYLQTPEILAEKLKKIIIKLIENFDFKELKELANEIKNMKDGSKLIDRITDLVNKLKDLLNDLINELLEKTNEIFIELKGNVAEEIKTILINKLKELQKKLKISKIMLDDEIFLKFHKYYQEIADKLGKETILIEYIKWETNVKEILKKLKEEIPLILEDIFNYAEDKFQKIYDIIDEEKERFKSLKKPIKLKEIIENELKEIGENPYEYLTSSKKYKLKSIPKQKFYLRYLCQPKEDTDEILVYDVEDQKEESNIITRVVKYIKSSFIPTKIPINCAWFNFNDNLYISGGILDGEPFKGILKFDPYTKKMVKVCDFMEDKSNYTMEEMFNHTMIIDENEYIYLIGGNSLNIYRYNLKSQRWKKFDDTLNAKLGRNHPICFIKENNLYIFFGIDKNGHFVHSYEKTNIKGNKNLVLVNLDNRNLIYSSVIYNKDEKDNFVYFMGGRNDLTSIREIFRFDLNENEIYLIKEIDKKVSFHQSIMPQISDNLFGNFTLEKEPMFFKINFKYN